MAAYQKLEGGMVRLGGGASAISFLVPRAIAAFQAEHPHREDDHGKEEQTYKGQ